MTHAAYRSSLHLTADRPSPQPGQRIAPARSPNNPLHPGWRTCLTRGLMLATLTTLGVLSGISAEWSNRTPRLVFETAAQAQSYSDADVVNYARAFLAIEPVRQQAIREIGSSATGIVCSDSNSFDALPREHRSVAVNYCNRSSEIVATFFGSDPAGRQRFNDIYRRTRGNPPADPALYQRVLSKICELAPDKCNR
ncbi:DUF4168 domain-containing protein [Trichothermofontia sp.]